MGTDLAPDDALAERLPAALAWPDGVEESDDAAGLLVRLMTCTTTEADRRALSRAVQSWVRDEGALSLQRHLGLPTRPAGLRRLRRDGHLIDAAREIEAEGKWFGALELERQLRDFVSRGPWRSWRDDGGPPADASRLRRALFYAVRFGDGETLSAKQLVRIVGHVWG